MGRQVSLGDMQAGIWCLREMPALFVFNALLQNTPSILFQSILKHISGQLSHCLPQLRGTMNACVPSSVH